MNKENSELSPEEKVKVEKFVNLLGETTGIFWRLSILWLLMMAIMDRVLSLALGINFVPYKEVPLYYPIWSCFGVVCLKKVKTIQTGKF